IVLSSFYAIPENVYKITGLPRNDLLMMPDSRNALERLLDINLEGKSVVFNMPTFHIFEGLGRVEGAVGMDDSFKIPKFDYHAFNNFLKENNLICVSKVHHGE